MKEVGIDPKRDLGHIFLKVLCIVTFILGADFSEVPKNKMPGKPMLQVAETVVILLMAD